MRTNLSPTELATIARIRSGAAKARTAAVTPPAGYACICPRCGEVGHATLIATWGHCMRCQQNG
jgi:hypothetical protein